MNADGRRWEMWDAGFGMRDRPSGFGVRCSDRVSRQFAVANGAAVLEGGGFRACGAIVVLYVHSRHRAPGSAAWKRGNGGSQSQIPRIGGWGARAHGGGGATRTRQHFNLSPVRRRQSKAGSGCRKALTRSPPHPHAILGRAPADFRGCRLRPRAPAGRGSRRVGRRGCGSGRRSSPAAGARRRRSPLCRGPRAAVPPRPTSCRLWREPRRLPRRSARSPPRSRPGSGSCSTTSRHSPLWLGSRTSTISRTRISSPERKGLPAGTAFSNHLPFRSRARSRWRYLPLHAQPRGFRPQVLAFDVGLQAKAVDQPARPAPSDLHLVRTARAAAPPEWRGSAPRTSWRRSSAPARPAGR